MPAEIEEVLSRFRYTVRVGRSRDEFEEIKQALSNGIAKRFNYGMVGEEGTNSPYSIAIYRAIANNAKSRFAESGVTQVYVSDYIETKGSLIISFFLIITSLATNYGSIRETADYFAEDIETMFIRAQEGNSTEYDVRVRVRPEQSHIINQANETNGTIELNIIKKLERKVLLSYALTFITFVITVSFATLNLLSKDEDAKISESSAAEEVKLSRIISNELRNQKIDEYLKVKSDTVYLIRK